MKTYTFPYTVTFGHGDFVDAEFDCALSNKMAARLEASARREERYDLDEDEAISDIYEHVLEKIIQENRRLLLEDPEAVADALSWDEDFDEEEEITPEQIDEYLEDLAFGVHYPEELQNLDSEEDDE